MTRKRTIIYFDWYLFEWWQFVFAFWRRRCAVIYIYMYIFCCLKAKYEIVAIKKSLPKIYNSWFQWILVIYFLVPPLCRWNMTRRYNLLYIFFSRNQALKQTSRNQALKHQQNKYFINFKCAESHTHTIARPYSQQNCPSSQINQLNVENRN